MKMHDHALREAARPMHDPQAECIRILETSVQRWRLVSLALMLVVVSFLAIGCTFGLMFIINQPDRREIEMMRMEAQEARRAAEQAMQEAERAKQQQMPQKNQW
jgi:hypothetical protein